MIHEAGVEQVDAGRHGRVSSEDVAGAGGFQRFVEGELVLAHVDADLFQREERGMALIHVEDGGLQTHGFERAHAADAEHDLLADARVVIAAVERIGDVAVLRQDVLGDVGIQQVERDAADFDVPDLDERFAGGQLDRDLKILAGGILDGLDGQSVEIVDRVALLLPSVGVEELAEVALLIEQPEADERVIRSLEDFR